MRHTFRHSLAFATSIFDIHGECRFLVRVPMAWIEKDIVEGIGLVCSQTAYRIDAHRISLHEQTLKFNYLRIKTKEVKGDRLSVNVHTGKLPPSTLHLHSQIVRNVKGFTLNLAYLS
jgi:hypothetical protein